MSAHPDYLTLAEAAVKLGISNQAVRQLCKRKTLRVRRFRMGYRLVAHISKAAVSKRLQERGSA
jgi:excisionase family DNA binding protein